MKVLPHSYFKFLIEGHSVNVESVEKAMFLTRSVSFTLIVLYICLYVPIPLESEYASSYKAILVAAWANWFYPNVKSFVQFIAMSKQNYKDWKRYHFDVIPDDI